MDNTTVWLEIDKSNQAVLSYFLEQPTTASDKVDYVPATKEELTYLSALEDSVFPAGMVATLTDLTEHRTRVQVTKATSPAKPAVKPPQQPSKSDSKPSSINPKTTNPGTKERFIAALKRHRANK